MTFAKKSIKILSLLFLAVTLLTACVLPAAEPELIINPAPILGKWIWQSATLSDGTQTEIYSTATFAPSITFAIDTDPNGDFDDSYRTASGNVGCNDFGTFYKLGAENSIEFSEISRTAKDCEPERINPEGHLIEHLVKVNRYEVKNSVLTLTTPAGDSLVFVQE